MNHMMVEEFEKLLGPLTPVNKNDALGAEMKALETQMINDAWLFRKGKRVEGRVVKVRAELEVVQRMHKAPGGLIRVESTIEDGRHRGVTISGDFFCFPRDAIDRLAAKLEDCATGNVSKVVSDFYQTEVF